VLLALQTSSCISSFNRRFRKCRCARASCAATAMQPTGAFSSVTLPLRVLQAEHGEVSISLPFVTVGSELRNRAGARGAGR